LRGNYLHKFGQRPETQFTFSRMCQTVKHAPLPTPLGAPQFTLTSRRNPGTPSKEYEPISSS
jgi:hypothetical protein